MLIFKEMSSPNEKDSLKSMTPNTMVWFSLLSSIIMCSVVKIPNKTTSFSIIVLIRTVTINPKLSSWKINIISATSCMLIGTVYAHGRILNSSRNFVQDHNFNRDALRDLHSNSLFGQGSISSLLYLERLPATGYHSHP